MMHPRALIAIGVALAFGLGGYALTGHPSMPATPAPPRITNPDLTPEAERASKDLLNNFGDIRAWLTLSDALIRANRTETAVTAMESALTAIPGSADLWVQMGVALVAHAQGEVVPAARLAFDRAAQLAPDHPAPPYFLALAWMQAGEPAKALDTLQGLAARSAPDAPWMPMVERMMRGARAMQAAGVGDGPPDEAAEADPAPANARESDGRSDGQAAG